MITDLTELANRSILYSLRREYNEKAGTFEYVLHVSAPMNGHIDVFLEHGLGDILALNWKQNDYGSFLGRHTMEWIIGCLTAGRPI